MVPTPNRCVCPSARACRSVPGAGTYPRTFIEGTLGLPGGIQEVITIKLQGNPQVKGQLTDRHRPGVQEMASEEPPKLGAGGSGEWGIHALWGPKASSTAAAAPEPAALLSEPLGLPWMPLFPAAYGHHSIPTSLHTN